MKLTKSQRLFIEVGRIDRLLVETKRWYRYDKAHNIETHAWSKSIKLLKCERKKLIRTALLEAENENTEIYDEGLRDAFTLPWED